MPSSRYHTLYAAWRDTRRSVLTFGIGLLLLPVGVVLPVHASAQVALTLLQKGGKPLPPETKVVVKLIPGTKTETLTRLPELPDTFNPDVITGDRKTRKQDYLITSESNENLYFVFAVTPQSEVYVSTDANGDKLTAYGVIIMPIYMNALAEVEDGAYAENEEHIRDFIAPPEVALFLIYADTHPRAGEVLPASTKIAVLTRKGTDIYRLKTLPKERTDAQRAENLILGEEGGTEKKYAPTRFSKEIHLVYAVTPEEELLVSTDGDGTAPLFDLIDKGEIFMVPVDKLFDEVPASDVIAIKENFSLSVSASPSDITRILRWILDHVLWMFAFLVIGFFVWRFYRTIFGRELIRKIIWSIRGIFRRIWRKIRGRHKGMNHDPHTGSADSSPRAPVPGEKMPRDFKTWQKEWNIYEQNPTSSTVPEPATKANKGLYIFQLDQYCKMLVSAEKIIADLEKKNANLARWLDDKNQSQHSDFPQERSVKEDWQDDPLDARYDEVRRKEKNTGGMRATTPQHTRKKKTMPRGKPGDQVAEIFKTWCTEEGGVMVGRYRMFEQTLQRQLRSAQAKQVYRDLARSPYEFFESTDDLKSTSEFWMVSLEGTYFLLPKPSGPNNFRDWHDIFRTPRGPVAPENLMSFEPAVLESTAPNAYRLKQEGKLG